MPRTPKPSNVRLDEDIEAGLVAIRERDGIPISEQMRRALRAWIDSKDIAAAPRRSGTRRST